MASLLHGLFASMPTPSAERLNHPLRHSVREVIQAYQYRLCNEKFRDKVKDQVGSSIQSREERSVGVTRSHVNLSEAYGGRRNKQLYGPVKAYGLRA